MPLSFKPEAQQSDAGIDPTSVTPIVLTASGNAFDDRALDLREGMKIHRWFLK
jgi:hypothetical protein